MKKNNYMGRLLALLALTTAMCIALYGLPGEIGGIKIRKVDLLSDIRVKQQQISPLDSIKQLLLQPDTLEADSIAEPVVAVNTTQTDSDALQRRDSLYKASRVAAKKTADVYIEDFSEGHVGLKRFFRAIKNSSQMGRPARVAFMGDSFIEGDIMVGDFRSAMQKEFGGRGVGFVPITSVTAQFRPTVEHKANGWKTISMLKNKKKCFVLPGTVFLPEKENATISLKNVRNNALLQEVESVGLIYEENRQTRVELVFTDNGSTDTIASQLPYTNRITLDQIKGNITQASYTFTETDGFRALGVALEDMSGVIVDNFSLRGNSGMILDRLDKEKCLEFAEIRPYDLIILQYGLNVLSSEVLDYGWYRQRMINVVEHLKECFPESDILLLGVTDRSHQVDGEYETMPEVLTLLHAQRQIAQRTGIAFWNMYEAMGGENSMIQYVEKNWASKDYTHFSFRGGRELAGALTKAILFEMKFYDEAETIHN
ncbi:hypothetical protein M2137_001946 [Parabacteroides sp. PFB2-10]|uniref:hypothetical protein n=1 Tax=Parabacteroides sp. PFB2-10 TaxID=1742405 RepID=UPI002476C5E4|nr:hypothetical protein [Parabacteroides sp. PFB2-10]MDH6313159.1 hypothetical protein [Parabacteroides sp. PFB2-10]